MMELSNVSIKKKKKAIECDKNTVICVLVLLNVMMEQSNMRKKNYGTTKYDKSTIKSDIGTV